MPKADGLKTAFSYGFNLFIYLALVIPAALTRRAWIFAVTIGLHIALYLYLVGLSILNPAAMAAAAVAAS